MQYAFERFELCAILYQRFLAPNILQSTLGGNAFSCAQFDGTGMPQGLLPTCSII